jgi:uncharacterized membrane protein YhaH (DUF805 family)
MSTGYTTPTDTALSQPLYGATFGQAVSRFFKKYATFTGRASRSEFWWWFLVNTLVGLVLYVITLLLGGSGATFDATTGTSTPGPGFVVGIVLSSIWFLATIVPWLALVWRRFHDTNRSGAFYFLSLIPFVGGIIVLVMLALPSDPAGARFDA